MASSPITSYQHSPANARNGARELTRITDRHREVMRLLLSGVQHNIIAIHTGYTAQQISNIANSPIVRMRLEQLHEKEDNHTLEVSRTLRRASMTAAQVVNRLMEDPNTPHGVLARVALGALDRTGFAPEKNIRVTHRDELAITADVIQDIKISYAEQVKSLEGITGEMKEALYAAEEGDEQEGDQSECEDGDATREATETGCSDCIL